LHVKLAPIHNPLLSVSTGKLPSKGNIKTTWSCQKQGSTNMEDHPASLTHFSQSCPPISICMPSWNIDTSMKLILTPLYFSIFTLDKSRLGAGH
jgi:hypothetical protein